MHTSVLEGVNNRIKVIKRMAYGFRDSEYFFLKIKAAFPGKRDEPFMPSDFFGIRLTLIRAQSCAPPNPPGNHQRTAVADPATLLQAKSPDYAGLSSLKASVQHY